MQTCCAIHCFRQLAKNRVRNSTERKRDLHRSKLDRFPRHAEDHTGLFALSKRSGSAITHLEEAACTVTTHASKQHADSILSRNPGNRREQDVNGRTTIADGRTIIDPNTTASSRLPQRHVEVPWCDQGATG